MKRKHCQKSRMNGRFCKILRESSKKGENIFVGVSSCAKGQKGYFAVVVLKKVQKKLLKYLVVWKSRRTFALAFGNETPGREFKERIT